MFKHCLIFLVAVAFAANTLFSAAAFAHQAGDCRGELVSREGLLYPRDLKLRDEYIPVLLDSAEYSKLMRALGEIFFLAENHPQFYGALAQMLAMPKELESLYADTDQGGMDELASRLNEDSEEFPLSEEAHGLLAQMFAKKVNMNSTILQSFHDTAKQLAEFSRILPQPFQAKAPPYLIDNFYRSIELMRGSPRFLEFAETFVEGYFRYPMNFDLRQFGINWRLPISVDKFQEFAISHEYFVDPSNHAHYHEFRKSVNLKSFRQIPIGITYYQIYNLIFYLRATQPFSNRIDMLGQIEREIDDRFDGVVIPDDIVNLLDHVYFGANVQESETSIRSALIEAAKIQLLTAKSYAAQLKIEKRQAEEEARRAAAPKLEIFSFITRSHLATPALNPNKRRHREKEPASTKRTSLAVPVPGETASSDSDLAHLIASAANVQADHEYKFDFLRNPQNGRQTIVFSPEVAKALNDMPSERPKFLRAIWLGYTSRSSQGTPGIKLIWRKAIGGKANYEVKPGNSDYRILMINAEGVWRPYRLAHKDHVGTI